MARGGGAAGRSELLTRTGQSDAFLLAEGALMLRRPVRGICFSYRPVVFQQGDFRFDVTDGVVRRRARRRRGRRLRAIFTYRRVRVNRAGCATAIVLTALRMAALALVLFCLFRPTLVVRAAVNQQNVVAVLLDDSRSMQIADWAGKPRGDVPPGAVRRRRQPAPEVAVRSVPGARVPVLVHRGARAVRSRTLTFGGSQTKLGTALDGVREELAGLPVAGVVLVSDGADTSEASLDHALLALKAEKLPVFTVGVGSEQAAARHPDRSRQHAAHGPEGRVAARRRGRHADRLRRTDGDRRRRRRRAHRRVAEGAAPGRRQPGGRARARDGG